MGPGRKLYHKPCLACTSCGKRLDSYSLLEHDQEPYCKNCHVKLFATRDLRLANLPNRDDVLLSPTSPPASPLRATTFLPTRTASPPVRQATAPPLPMRRHATGGGSIDRTPFTSPSPAPPMLRPTRALSPTRSAGAEPTRSFQTAVDEQDETDEVDEQPIRMTTGVGSTPTHTGRSAGGLPRTVPLSPVRNRFGSISSPAKPPPSDSDADVADAAEKSGADANARLTMPLFPTSTGTRYGMALSGNGASPSTGKQWGGGTPVCPKCGKTVYFAEQVKAIGKTYHKGCLRCTECKTSLDSTRLTERDGHPYCHRCYGKLYGPQGSGYALLGKAGG